MEKQSKTRGHRQSVVWPCSTDVSGGRDHGKFKTEKNVDKESVKTIIPNGVTDIFRQALVRCSPWWNRQAAENPKFALQRF